MKITPIISHKTEENQPFTTVQSDISLADDQRALQYKKLNMLMQMDPMGNLSPYPYCVPSADLAKHGLGLQLFFTFLTRMIIIFSIMSILAIIACVSNGIGDGLSQWKNLNLIQVLSVGNQPVAKTSGLEQFYQDSLKYHTILTWLDFSYIVIFMIFWAFFSYWAERLIAYQNSTSQVPANFSLALSGFESTENDPKALTQFLSKYASIKEVKFAKNYSNTLFLHKEEAELQVQIKIENLKIGTRKENQKKIEQMKNKLVIVEQQRNRIINEKFGRLSRHNQYPSLFAFVVFESISDKQVFIKEYTQKTEFNFIQRLCGKKIEKEDLFKDDFKLIIHKKVDNPSNIKWENLEVTKFQRLWRSFVVYFGIFLLMIITFMVVFGINVVSKYTPQNCPTTLYTYDETQTKIAESTVDSDKTQLKNCFCMNTDLTSLYLTYTSYCSEIIYQYTAVQGLQISSAFVIVIVNSLLNYLIVKISNFVRYPSLSQQLSSTMITNFVAIFINTAIVPLLLKASIFGVEPALYLSSPIPPLQNAQKYDTFPTDFNRDWYALVGAAYVNTWIINIFSPYVIYFILTPLIKHFRDSAAREAISQRERNRYIVGPDFELGTHYSYTLNTIAVTLFYSSAIPIMLPLGTIALLIQYLTQKYLLLNYYRKPPAYDEALHKLATATLPFMALGHILIAIWVYGYPFIFPSSGTILKVETQSTGDVIVATQDSFWIRITNTINLSLLGAAIIGLLALKQFLVNPLSYLFGLCFGDETDIEAISAKVKYSDIMADIQHHQLATYEIMENEQYQDLIVAIDNMSPGQDNQNSFRQEQHQLKIRIFDN